MSIIDLIAAYNYDSFIEEAVSPWMNFADSPLLGETAPDFPLWHLDGSETSLSLIVTAHRFTVVEFGSFT
ncbi:MAG: hypothetical protein H6654_11675 [Ardenticatenaceae bacterium]|nr:hypothetical protein [Anaerolineales bacterium]MCB8937639.1 hypothetical protein [Ardenticatenaceae bacterium]MCB8974208.1 hypothetical protein [Ardenticatenaceae bacterium]